MTKILSRRSQPFFAIAGLALVIAPLVAAAPAQAHAATAPDNAEGTDLRQLTVDYHDLDLTTARGRRQLEMRIDHAAADVCGYDRGARPPAEMVDGRKCYVDALSHAHATIASRLAAQTLVSR